MIFDVLLNNKTLFHSGDDVCAIGNAVLEQALNEAGTFECDVPLTNPLYHEIYVRSSMIQIIKDGKEIFYGQVREVTQNFDFSKHIYVVGELAFLFDSIQPQARYQCTPSEFLGALITLHNNQVDEYKRFAMGNCTIIDNNDYLYRYTNMEDTLTNIREKLCDKYKGFLKIRKENGTRYLDLVPLEQMGTLSTQEIHFGENMLDYSYNTSASDIATAVIPLGARLEEEQRTSDAVDGLDEYLTIKSVNDGVDYLYNVDAINLYGWVKVVQQWDDVTDAATLKTKAETWLSSTQFAKIVLELNAFDLSNLDANINSFDIGDMVRAVAQPFGMDTQFPVRKKTTYLNDLSKNYITLGDEAVKTYTSQASTATNAVRSEIPQTSPILQDAKKRALAVLTGNEGGYVSFVLNEDGNSIKEIIITDAPTEAAALKKWVWNLSGLGYMHRNNTSDAWTDLGVAMTMQGEIVGDFITAGTIDAEKVNVTNVQAKTVLTATGADYVNVKEGDIFGGSAAGQHGYISFSTLSGGKKGISITGTDFVNVNGELMAGGLKGTTNVIAFPQAYVDGAMRQSVALTFTNGILTNITY